MEQAAPEACRRATSRKSSRISGGVRGPMDLGEGRLQLVVMVLENGEIGDQAGAAESRARRSGWRPPGCT